MQFQPFNEKSTKVNVSLYFQVDDWIVFGIVIFQTTQSCVPMELPAANEEFAPCLAAADNDTTTWDITGMAQASTKDTEPRP